ncbi:MAG: hydroxyacid dehydrogenase [Pseudomonadota bacterium]
MHVVVTEFMDETALERFGPEIRLTYDPGLVDDRARMRAAAGSATAIIVRNKTQVDSELLDAAPELKVVGRLGVGLDNIDLQACESRGISVFPATGANTASVAEYVIGSAMVLTRGAYGATAQMIAGDWPRGTLGQGGEIAGRTLGLIGYGGIARAVAVLARGLGMKIIAHDPHVPAEDPAWTDTDRGTVEEVLARADIVSLHVPLTPETAQLIDAGAIAAMKPGAILINTARGGIVDEAALVAALRSGYLAGAALDVFAEEPLTAEAGARFADVPNLILTPHIAGVTGPANSRVSHMTVENVLRALQDR